MVWSIINICANTYINTQVLGYADIVVWKLMILIGIRSTRGIQSIGKRLDFSLIIMFGGQSNHNMLEYIYALTRTRNSERS